MLAVESHVSRRRQSVVSSSEHSLSNTTKDELMLLKQTFSLFDKDGDGIITGEELGSVLKSLNQSVSEQELKTLIHEVSRSDTISFEDFVRLMKAPTIQAVPRARRSSISHLKPRTPSSPTNTGLFGSLGFSKKVSPSTGKPSSPPSPKSSSPTGAKPFSLTGLFTKKKNVEEDDIVEEEMDHTEEMRQVFKVFDINGDGFVSVSEMKNIMAKLGLGIVMKEEEVRSLFRLVDKDDDGHINFEEFIQLFSMS